MGRPPHSSASSGNSIRKPSAPRIISLAPSATSILYAIGAAKTLIGVSKWCNDVAPVKHLPAFGDFWKNNDAMKIAALKPDLVVGSVPLAEDAIQKLLAARLNILALNPTTLSDTERDILQLGALANASAGARNFIKKWRKQFEAARKRSRGKRIVKLYCEAWPKPRIASPPWVAELAEMAGAVCVPIVGARTNEEAVAAANPELIVLAWAAVGVKSNPAKAYAVAEWKNVTAIRRSQVVVVRDEFLNTPGPPLLRGLTELELACGKCRRADIDAAADTFESE